MLLTITKFGTISSACQDLFIRVIGQSFLCEEDDFGADQINWGTPMFSLSGERDGSPPIPGRNGRLQIAPETEGVARRLNSLIAQPTASRGASHGSYATWLFGY